MKFDEMNKEDLELLSYKDITNLILEDSKQLNTADLFKIITTKLEMSSKEYESKIGDYYTMLTTDKRFVLLEDGCWDLRKRHTSDKVVIVSDDDDENEDELLKVKEEDDNIDEDENFDSENEDEDFDSDDDDSLNDLVILDEDELELEQ